MILESRPPKTSSASSTEIPSLRRSLRGASVLRPGSEAERSTMLVAWAEGFSDGFFSVSASVVWVF